MSSFFIKSSSSRQVAPSSTPIHTSAQWVRRSAGQDLHPPRAPGTQQGSPVAPQEDPLPQPSIIPPLSHCGCQHSHLCRGQAQSATPVLFAGCHSCGGHQDMSDTAQSLPAACWLLTLTCWHCPTATSCCRSCSSSPGCPAPCNNTAGQTAVPPLPDTGVPVPPVPLMPGHGGPFPFTVLVKLARGVQAPCSTAHSEAFPPCSSSRRSSGRPGSAPGNVPGGWGGSEGRPRRATPQLDPLAAPTLPPQQYSRSRRHWVSRTCPPLHTCPREWINSTWE